MALSRTAKATLSRSEIVSYHLRRMAKKADPVNGWLMVLADDLEVHPTTISDWIAQGYIPQHQCKRLHKRFGKLAPFDELCPLENRPR